MTDEIMEELWNTKDAIAKQFGCDVRALVAHLRSRKRDEGGRAIDPGSLKRASEQNNVADGESSGV